VKVTAWVEDVRKAFESGKKLSMQDAKSLFETGEKLKVNTQELRTLRGSLRAARGWANRVKRCNLDQGAVHVSNVQDLIAEHQSFLIEMPEELSTLKQATQSYCVCRRPYDGFMIGCDECEEWYHGPCIGVSESRADRFDKYVCIRCSVKNVFKNSASAAVGIIRKWTSRKDLKKARQVEYQKHQRKVRKEAKDIEKCRKEIKNLKEKLAGASQAQAPQQIKNMVDGRSDKEATFLPAVSDSALKEVAEETIESPPNSSDAINGTNEEIAPECDAEEVKDTKSAKIEGTARCVGSIFLIDGIF
jgi:hypothetical protein